MLKKRIIARIDIKNEFVIKGIHLEGLRKVGNPNDMAKFYYDEGIDEIFFMDAVAAYYDRNSLGEIISKATKSVFVPITVGGGIRTIDDIREALASGADKVAINTQAVRTPEIINKAARIFGSQCIVASIQAKKIAHDKWEAYIDNGREPAGLDVLQWAIKLEQLGAGEIMVTSVDQEGTKKGYDVALCSLLANSVSLPIIASGGAGTPQDISNLCRNSDVDAIAVASILHYNLSSIGAIKSLLHSEGFNIRL
ncbi:MAG: imidazole glycerol phosphate synthase cyclase subunit [Candidatus Polarisedimenticolaceae bacterium]|nr:imidazole glycerol phosphate synthase cyclase subunit [Candidatus Polarisedimenticolaceae bacterium]